MYKAYKNKKFKVSKWIELEYIVVDNDKHELWDYLQENIENGNFNPDETTVPCFKINSHFYTLEDILDRFNKFWVCFDVECNEYPKQINGIIEDGNYLVELDSYGERLRIWDELK